MTAPVVAGGVPYGNSDGTLYDPAMAHTELLGIENTRKALGDRVNKAKAEELHTVMTRHGQAEAVIVDMAWYRKARKALKDPTDL